MTSKAAHHIVGDRSSTVPKLILQFEGDGDAVTFPLIGAEILIGRLDSVDLVLEDPAVSRVHAKIVREAGGWVIIDLESSCGTLVNGERVNRHRLSPGDLIEIASARLEYRE
jgi:pSer/pThr/pTyr-binding forkhead associated (FHA) protein